MPMHQQTQSLADRHFLNVTIVDTETTGLDRISDEVIGIGLLCLRLNVQSGRPEGLVASTFQWREPVTMSAEVEALLGITRAGLKGRRFDQEEMDRILQQTDLIVAHAAEFDRQFLEPLIPALSALPWACSLTQIGWRSEERLERASLDYLLALHGRPPSSTRPEADCDALAHVLAQPLPRSPCTGFRRLIEAADAVLIECTFAEHGEPESEAGSALTALGFVETDLRWRAYCRNAAEADALEAEINQHAADNPSFATLKMWRVDARSRFSTRALPIICG